MKTRETGVEQPTPDNKTVTAADWFSADKGDKAYEAAKSAAIKTAQAEKSIDSMRRTLCITVYRFIIVVMPIEELPKLEQRLGAEKPDHRIVMPTEVLHAVQGTAASSSEQRKPVHRRV